MTIATKYFHSPYEDLKSKFYIESKSFHFFNGKFFVNNFFKYLVGAVQTANSDKGIQQLFLSLDTSTRTQGSIRWGVKDQISTGQLSWDNFTNKIIILVK